MLCPNSRLQIYLSKAIHPQEPRLTPEFMEEVPKVLASINFCSDLQGEVKGF